MMRLAKIEFILLVIFILIPFQNQAVGDAFRTTKRTTSPYSKLLPQHHVVDRKIFYLWQEVDVGSKSQIWTAVMDIDGTGWFPVKRTSTAFNKLFPKFQVAGSMIYFGWCEYDGSNYQIWTAVMHTDGSG